MNYLRKKAYSLLNKIYFEYDRIRDYRRDKHLIRELNLRKLSRKEKQEIKKTWPCFKFSNLDFIWMRIYKAEHGFDPYYLCDHQYAQLLRLINSSSGWISLVNKALYDIYMPKIPWPFVYIRRINNKYYNHDMVNIGVDESIDFLMSLDKYVVKPAVDTGGGKGVKVINKRIERGEIEKLLKQYDTDLVVQALINQDDELRSYNPTSVNSCRITTIHMGNKRSHSAIFKVGCKNSTVDNWNSSILLGVSKEGELSSYGYDVNLKRILQSDEGVTFEGKKIPGFSKMVYSVHSYHDHYFPKTAIVGWDITIDNAENPIVIEANLGFPGIAGEQICSGTFFKDFRDEICNYFVK